MATRRKAVDGVPRGRRRPAGCIDTRSVTCFMHGVSLSAVPPPCLIRGTVRPRVVADDSDDPTRRPPFVWRIVEVAEAGHQSTSISAVPTYAVPT